MSDGKPTSEDGVLHLRRVVRIERPAAVVFAWHEQAGAFERMAPPWARVDKLTHVGGIRNGARLRMRQHSGLLRMLWEVEHTDFIAGRQFRDVARRSPFREWNHLHRVEPQGDKACLWIDEVRYRLPAGGLGRALLGRTIRGELERLFTYRHAVLKADLERAPVFNPQRILVAGASGLIGKSLVAYLTTQGHDVLRLVRHPAVELDELTWNPNLAHLQAGPLDGIDAVINLSGANIAEGRWSDRRRDAIIHSRRMATRTLVNAFKEMRCRPKVFISGSAVGYYGDGGDRLLHENCPVGDGFLAEVCASWEEEAMRAESFGVRTAVIRTGVVLTPAGGALAKMLPLFRMGLGGPIGGGRSWMSWISAEDHVAAVLHAIASSRMSGPYNFVAPEPVTNAEFTSTLGSVLRRPAFLPVPAVALRAIFGQMADETLLSSQRALPERLLAAGYEFRHAGLESALRHMLGLATPIPNP